MQSDKLNTNLTNEQLEGIRAHEIEFKRIVKLVNEKYERIKQEKFEQTQSRKKRQTSQQAPKN